MAGVWLVALLVVAGGARAAPANAPADNLARFAQVFPDATRFGTVEGVPPAAAAYVGENLAGYVFFTRGVVASVGYSGKPLNVLVGVDRRAHITGALIVEQHEPILVIGVSPEQLDAFVAQYRGRDVREPASVAIRERGEPGAIDAVAGASVSSVVLNDSIIRAARAVALSRGIIGDAGRQIDYHGFANAAWKTLVGEGSIVRRRITVAEANAALAEKGAGLFPEGVPPPAADALFGDLYIGLATPARVGRNLLGDQLYNRVVAGRAAGDQIVFVAAEGLYSFKGTAYRRSGIFDRLQLVQGDRTIQFRSADHVGVEKLAVADAPELREIGLFIVPEAAGFDASAPWRLEFLVTREDRQGRTVHANFAAGYQLPARYVLAPLTAAVSVPDRPLWEEVWRSRITDIAILVVALLVLTAILVFQDALSRRQRLYLYVRYGFLAFTLFWLGWYAVAQLSVVNVLTFANALRTEFDWGFFLLDPLLFVLWGYVAVSMLFLGRGVFCGWLCPFGALQELSNRLARWARIPQWRLPFALHERLWPVKYIIFLGLFALSLNAVELAQTAAEVEPFKTAVVLKFARAWPFVVYAGGLLGIGLFVERFFCRYLCPLGAALAIPARVRMFDWLKRRWQCGLQCQICSLRCPVQAIHPDGRINPNECIHCLNCQTIYYDDQTCPPLAERRKRRKPVMTQRLIDRFARAEAEQDGGADAATPSPTGGDS